MRGLLLFLIGAFAAGVLGWVFRRGRARARLARLARRLELNYTPADAHGLCRRLRQLTLFNQGHNRSAFDIVSGGTRWGTVYGFRYRYQRGFGIDRQTYRWTVAAVEFDRTLADVLLWHPALPDERLRTALSGVHEVGEAPQPSGADGAERAISEIRAWFAALDFPAALECRGPFIILCAADEGTEGQYERLLTAVEHLAQAAVSD